MTFGQNNTKELKTIIGEIKLSEILSAFNYIDTNGIPSKRGADTCYFIHNNVQYPVKLVTEIINNVIKNNTKQLSPAEHDPWQDAPLYDDVDLPEDTILITPYNNSGRKCVEQYRQELLDNFTNLNIVDVNTNYTKIEKDHKNIAEIHFLNKRDNQFKILVNYDLLPKEMTTTTKKSIKGFRKVPDSHNWTLNGEYYVTTNPQTIKFAINAINTIIEKNNFDQTPTKFWLYSAGEKSYKWNDFYKEGIMALGWDNLGNLKNYHTQEEIAQKLQKHDSQDSYPMNNSKANWEFANKMNIGDIVYVKQGLDPILLGRGVVDSDYIYDDTRNEYKSIRKVNWTHNGIYNVDFNELDIKQWNQKTLTDISENKYKDFCKKIEKIFNNNAKEDKNMNFQPLNQILYGPPGTGKTYSLSSIVKNILCSNKESIKKKSLKEITQETPWWQAIALTMYQNNKTKKYKVPELETLLTYYISLKNNKTVKNKIWEQLQKHTDFTSETVFAKDRNEPFIFDKTKDSEWYITEKGLNYINDQLINKEQINVPIETIDKYTNFVTFHQSYSYEEFIEGIKPSTKDGQIKYAIENGIFKKMCIKANADPENNYVLVIDEINRGNISKIFGELITLIEKDKRIIPNGTNDIDDFDLNIDENSKSENSIIVKLPYSQKDFGVPSNLYILGTMNTSDRSIASIDIALRRRFKFVEKMPRPELVADFGCGFQSVFEKLNTKIKILLDRDHQIGHSYFINTKYANADISILKEIWFSEIIPLLNEYFYCDWEKLKLVIPGFIKEINIPEELKNECEDSIYEFKTPNEVEDFVGALKQDKFKQEN